MKNLEGTRTYSELQRCPSTTLGVWKRPPYIEGKERPKNGADDFGLLGGKFNKQGNLWGFCRVTARHGGLCTVSAPAHQNRKVYVETLTGFSHLFSPDGLNNTVLSQWSVLENSSCCGIVHRTYIPRARRGWGASDCPQVLVEGQQKVISSQWPLTAFTERNLSLGKAHLVYWEKSMPALCCRGRHYACFSKLQANDPFVLEENNISTFQGCSLY